MSSYWCQRKHHFGRPIDVLNCKVELAEGVQAIMTIDFQFNLTFITLEDTVRPQLINHELFGACQKWSWEKEERESAEGCLCQLGTSRGRLLSFVRKENKMAGFRCSVYQEFPMQNKFPILRKSFLHDM